MKDFFTLNLSERHNLRKYNYVFDTTFVTILSYVNGDILASLSSHIYFRSSVLFLYLECLKSYVWLVKHSLEIVSVTLKENFFSPFVGFLRCAFFRVRHLFCTGFPWIYSYNHIYHKFTPKYRNSTGLSKYMWKFKDTNISLVTEWSIVT